MRLFPTLMVALLLVLPAGAEDVTFGPYTAKAPKDWKFSESTSSMRMAQAMIPAAKDDKADAEMVVFFFGEGGGGDLKANMGRWKGMFAPPEGKKIDDVSKESEFKLLDDKVTVNALEVEGTYKAKARPFDPNSPVVENKDYKMINYVINCEKGPYFVRVTGPAKTIDARKAEILAWIKGMK